MRHIGDRSHREDFDDRIKNHHRVSRKRKDTEQQNPFFGKIGGKSKQHAENGTRSADQQNILSGQPVNQKREESGADTRKKVKKRVVGRSHAPFHRCSEKVKGNHIEKQMRDTAVGEHIGEKLPEKESFGNRLRKKTEIKINGRGEHA